MEPVTWVFVAVAAVLTFAIAAGVIGREAHRLDSVAPRTVYDIDEAVEFVADRLPADSQARLTPDELATMLALHLRWLHDKGLQPDRVVDRPQDITSTTIVTDDSVVAHLLGEADSNGITVLDDVDVVNVVDAHLAYFDAIGAIGPTARLDGADADG
jgi:hypothetical protein